MPNNLSKSESSLLHTPYELGKLSVEEIERIIPSRPSMLVPIGGLEPIGLSAPLEVASVCVRAIAAEVSRKTKILCAPYVPLSFSVMFKAFGGVPSVHTSTLAKALVDLFSGWGLQGIRSFVVIDAGSLNEQAVLECASRLRNRGTDVSYFSWQKAAAIQPLLQKRCPGFHDRCEFGILSMCSWVCPELLVNFRNESRAGSRPPGDAFTRWKKRGRDPEQFRKAYSNAWISGDSQDPDAQFGKELFERATSLLISQIDRDMNV